MGDGGWGRRKAVLATQTRGHQKMGEDGGKGDREPRVKVVGQRCCARGPFRFEPRISDSILSGLKGGTHYGSAGQRVRRW